MYAAYASLQNYVLSLITVSSAFTYALTSLAPVSVMSRLFPSTETTGTASKSLATSLMPYLTCLSPRVLSWIKASASVSSRPASTQASSSVSSAAGCRASAKYRRYRASTRRLAISGPFSAWTYWIMRCAWNVLPIGPSNRNV